MAKRKPYLSYELDAGRDADLAAQKAGVHSDVTRAGLTRLWEHCWRKKTDRVTPDELGCFFTGCDEKLRRALALMKFIEIDGHPSGDRVKGAERLLRISASRSKGGHAAKGNLKQGTVKPDSAPAHAGGSPACAPAAARLLQPAANSQQPTTPPNPLAREGAREHQRACRCKRHPCRHEPKPAPDTGRVLEIGRCAACGSGASAGIGSGGFEVKLCYGGCLAAAQRWAEEQSPAEPWKADVLGWAMAQRAMRAAEHAREGPWLPPGVGPPIEVRSPNEGATA